jgi:hypothetical protein
MLLTKEHIDEITEAFKDLDPDNEFEIRVNDLEIGETEVIVFSQEMTFKF